MKFNILLLTFCLSSIVFALEDEEYFVEATAYNEDDATRYWYFCAASYCDPSKIVNWSCTTPCSKTPYMQDVHVFLNSSNENSGFTGYDPKHNEIIFVFRGTVPWMIKNWMEDLNYIKTDYPYCNNDCFVHRYYL